VVSDGESSWAEAAAEHGYYDQSHLIHDFRELAGITPTAYRPRSAAERNHVPLSSAA
jgi:AraC-like DNA-binding protein